MLKNNYHTHMRFCNHADGDVSDYVKVAYENGFKELGMSDHAPIPLNHGMTEEEYKKCYCSENMDLNKFNEYLNQIDECRKKYQKIKIYKALESEYLYNNDNWYMNLRKKLDYMILGVHFYSFKGKIIDSYNEIDYTNLIGYIENIDRAFSTGLFNYLAHPDLFLFNYKDKNGKYSFDNNCINATKKIIDLAVKYDIYLEINCNGLKFVNNKDDINEWKYPNLKFWEIVKDYQNKYPGRLKIIIGADAHTPMALCNDNVLKTIEFVNKLGLKVENKIKL